MMWTAEPLRPEAEHESLLSFRALGAGKYCERKVPAILEIAAPHAPQDREMGRRVPGALYGGWLPFAAPDCARRRRQAASPRTQSRSVYQIGAHEPLCAFLLDQWPADQRSGWPAVHILGPSLRKFPGRLVFRPPVGLQGIQHHQYLRSGSTQQRFDLQFFRSHRQVFERRSTIKTSVSTDGSADRQAADSTGQSFPERSITPRTVRAPYRTTEE